MRAYSLRTGSTHALVGPDGRFGRAVVGARVLSGRKRRSGNAGLDDGAAPGRRDDPQRPLDRPQSLPHADQPESGMRVPAPLREPAALVLDPQDDVTIGLLERDLRLCRPAVAHDV